MGNALRLVSVTENIIEISFSCNQNSGELDLSGSPKALQYVCESILNLIHDENRVICVIETAIFDPTP